MTQLQNGDLFPKITIDTVSHGVVTLPDDLSGHHSVVLFYRGSWCPYCNAQLAAFERAKEQLAATGISVVALSVDDAATSTELVAKRHLTFPIGYGADASALAASTGAYTNTDPEYLQSTGFVLDPAGRIITAVYSSNAIGRLMPEDVVGFIKHVMEAA